MSTGLRELRVWQEAVALAADVVRALRRAGRHADAPPLPALAASALTLAGEIAEGAGRWSPAEQRGHYASARGALLRVDTMLAIARQAELLDGATCARLSERTATVGRLLGGYLAYLERQLAESTPAPHTRPGVGGGSAPAAAVTAAGGSGA